MMNQMERKQLKILRQRLRQQLRHRKQQKKKLKN
nr:MAG TPA: hypothetical protein [Caudoviricetes sp.]